MTRAAGPSLGASHIGGTGKMTKYIWEVVEVAIGVAILGFVTWLCVQPWVWWYWGVVVWR